MPRLSRRCGNESRRHRRNLLRDHLRGESRDAQLDALLGRKVAGWFSVYAYDFDRLHITDNPNTPEPGLVVADCNALETRLFALLAGSRAEFSAGGLAQRINRCREGVGVALPATWGNVKAKYDGDR